MKLSVKQIYEAVGAIITLAEAGVHLTPSTKDDAVVAQLRKLYDQLGALIVTDASPLKAAAPCDDAEVNALVAQIQAACPCDDDCCPDDGG